MNLGEVKQALDRENIQLTKSLGQNFLHDCNQLRRIVAAANLKPCDQVLEIGPGLGALTQLLLQEVPTVLAIEKDARLVRHLHSRLQNPALRLLHADALELLRTEKRDWSAWKVVSNLPYSVGSSILVELAKSAGVPECMVVTLQLEVAERLAARAGDDDFGILSLLVQLRFEPRGMFKIPASCFFPVPDVVSACVTLARRPTLLLEPALARVFEKIVKRGFSQRRKMMMKLLKADWPLAKLGRAFVKLGLSPQARAETVSLEQFVELTKYLAATGEEI